MDKETITTCELNGNDIISLDNMVACQSCGRDKYQVYLNLEEKKLELVCVCCDFEITLSTYNLAISNVKQHDELPDSIRWKHLTCFADAKKE